MKKIIECTFIFFLLAIIAKGQNSDSLSALPSLYYGEMAYKGDSLFKAGQYKQAAKHYRLAFASFGWRGYVKDQHKLICAYTKINKPDSAFKYLFDLVKYGQLNLKELINDSCFNPLHSKDRWKAVLDSIKNANQTNWKVSKPKLAGLMDSLVYYDQKWRTVKPNDTLTQKEIYRNWSKTDSLDYLYLKRIIAKYGCPNFKMVGGKSAMNFWLLVQHQDRHVAFQEKVLNLMKTQVYNKQFNPKFYAYLIDRIKVNTNQKQIYGTQLIYKNGKLVVKPTVNPNELDYRRFQMGLNSEEVYIKMADGVK